MHVRLVWGWSRVRSSRPATSFHGDWNNFCGHYLPSPDSRRAVVSYWKNVPRNSVDKLTDRAQMTWKVAKGSKTLTQQQQQLLLYCIFQVLVSQSLWYQTWWICSVCLYPQQGVMSYKVWVYLITLGQIRQIRDIYSSQSQKSCLVPFAFKFFRFCFKECVILFMVVLYLFV